MVLYWIVVFTGLRAAVIDYALLPLARKGGVKIEKDKIRFAEQAWLLIYYSVFSTLGMVSCYCSKTCSLLTAAVYMGELGVLAQPERTLD